MSVQIQGEKVRGREKRCVSESTARPQKEQESGGVGQWIFSEKLEEVKIER